MKKFILVLVAVSSLGFTTQAQKVTKIYGSYAKYKDVEFSSRGDTFYYQGAVFNVSFRLSFEFKNGGMHLNGGDTVIVGGSFTGQVYSDDPDNPYVINGNTYKGLLFKVPTGGIAPDSSYVFEDKYAIKVSYGGVNGSTGSASVNSNCMYVSSYGHLKYEKTQPYDVSRNFYLIQDIDAVSEAALATVKIFPTLVSNELQLTNLRNTDVAVYSLVGQQMLKYSDQTGNISIDVSSLANGIYFVKIQSGGAVRTEKIKIVR